MLMKNFLLILLYFINNVLVLSAQGTPGKWGDQGNGTYINPILNADYSDPDVIRVRDKYYMIASDFHFLGMQVLESSDMINWKLISQIYHHFDFPGWDNNQQYAGVHGHPQFVTMITNSGSFSVLPKKDYSCQMLSILQVLGALYI